MDGDSFGTPPEAHKSVNPSPSGFPEIVFLNKTGLRAGWRLLIYAALFFVFWSVSIYLLGLFLRPAWGVFSLSFQFFGEMASFLSAFLAAWIMSKLETRPMSVYGLPARGAFGKLFWIGCFFGFLEIFALIALVSAFGVFLREPRRAWWSDREVGCFLGRIFPRGRSVRGISFPRLRFVHSGRRHRFLARRCSACRCIRMGSQTQFRRGLGRSRRRGFRGLVLGIHSEAYGKPVVCARHARGLRFRRDVSVFCSGQRNDFSGPSFERNIARAQLANGGHTWPRG